MSPNVVTLYLTANSSRSDDIMRAAFGAISSDLDRLHLNEATLESGVAQSWDIATSAKVGHLLRPSVLHHFPICPLSALPLSSLTLIYFIITHTHTHTHVLLRFVNPSCVYKENGSYFSLRSLKENVKRIIITDCINYRFAY